MTNGLKTYSLCVEVIITVSDIPIKRAPCTHSRHRIAVAAGVALVIAVLFPFLALVGLQSPAGAQAAEEEAFLEKLNETRVELGLSELNLSAELTNLSRIWAAEMAEEGEIFHANPISANMTSNWLKLGENVGVGPEVGALMDAFIDSPTHYQNIIDPEFTHVGVGVVWDGDLMFTTHRFMKVADRTLSTPTTSIPGQQDQPLEAQLEVLPTSARPVTPPASERRIGVLVEALASQAN